MLSFITAIPGKLYAFSDKHPRLTVLFVICIGVFFYYAFYGAISYYRTPMLEISVEQIEQPYGEEMYYALDRPSRVFPSHRTMPLDYSPYYYLITIKNSGSSRSMELEFDYDDNNSCETRSVSIKRNSTFQTVIPASHMLQDVRVNGLMPHTYRFLTPQHAPFPSCICIGILGDHSEQFINMVFESYPYNMENTNYPLEAISLNADNIKESLPSLTLLMIDNYDTASLPEDVRTDIINWAYNGGLLILGGGSTASRNLSGFKDDFLPYKYEIIPYKKVPREVISKSYPYKDYPISLPVAEWLNNTGHEKNTGITLNCKSGAVALLYYSPYEIQSRLDSGTLDSQTSKQTFCEILYETIDSLYWHYNRYGLGPLDDFL